VAVDASLAPDGEMSFLSDGKLCDLQYDGEAITARRGGGAHASALHPCTCCIDALCAPPPVEQAVASAKASGPSGRGRSRLPKGTCGAGGVVGKVARHVLLGARWSVACGDAGRRLLINGMQDGFSNTTGGETTFKSVVSETAFKSVNSLSVAESFSPSFVQGDTEKGFPCATLSTTTCRNVESSTHISFDMAARATSNCCTFISDSNVGTMVSKIWFASAAVNWLLVNSQVVHNW